MALTVPNVTTRAGKGSALTAAEHDANLTILKNAIQAAFTLLGVSLNTDGSVKADSIIEAAIQNRQIGDTKLKLTAFKIHQDAGTTNNFVITPTPAAAAYENSQVFLVRALNENTGPSTFKVNALDALALKNRGGFELQAGDIKLNQIFVVGIYNGEAHVVGGIGGSGGSDSDSPNLIDETGNLQGVIYNASGAIPADGANLEFTHGLDAAPDSYDVFLENVTPDGIYGAGDLIPIGQITDNAVTFVPVFRVEVNSSKIIVYRDSPNAYDNVAGAALDIATPDWRLRVKAVRQFSPSLVLATPTSFQMKRPDGALTYGQYAYVVSRGYADTDVNRMLRIDTQTGQALVVSTRNTAERHFHFSAYRDADDVDVLAWVTARGIHVTTLQKPAGAWVISDIVATTDFSKYRLLDIADTAGTGEHDIDAPTDATVWLGPQRRSTDTVDNVVCKKVVFPAGTVTNQTAIDFTDAAISDVADFAALAGGNAVVLSLNYNPVKNRLYLTDASTGMVHIFTLDEALRVWLQNTPTVLDYTKLHYEKSIVVGGGIITTAHTYAGAGSAVSESVAIEFDLGSGDEQAIVLTQTGGTAYNTGAGQESDAVGIVTRIPWRE